MKVYLGSDHGGYELKERIKSWLQEWGYAFEDMGATRFDPSDDYPDFIIPVARRVSSEKGSLGVVLGRSGSGEAIAANKVRGVRAAVCLNEEMAKKAREKNNANVLSLGGDLVDEAVAKRIVKVFLETPFSEEERHKRRLGKIDEVERGQ
ncbi:RpiB/LacA/LacB family sugar-phosphate isomerase [Patescibacteria group bacterium]|nr:RpiB/LacA/LacB family sugar-phosphate isomerase [Patescibacteria group bacterium]